jgi:hypothetical protein
MKEVPNSRGLSQVNELSEARLWKTLDGISDKLTVVESQLTEVVRLEERVNGHDQAISRFGAKLDNHDRRIHEAELWQAGSGDKSSTERMIVTFKEEVVALKKKLEDLQNSGNVIKGQRDVGKEILKWVAGILSATIVFILTRG